MNGKRTHSILERAPEILAVTAASYGLPELNRAQAQAQAALSDQRMGNTARRTASASGPARFVRETSPRAH